MPTANLYSTSTLLFGSVPPAVIAPRVFGRAYTNSTAAWTATTAYTDGPVGDTATFFRVASAPGVPVSLFAEGMYSFTAPNVWPTPGAMFTAFSFTFSPTINGSPGSSVAGYLLSIVKGGATGQVASGAVVPGVTAQTITGTGSFFYCPDAILLSVSHIRLSTGAPQMDITLSDFRVTLGPPSPLLIGSTGTLLFGGTASLGTSASALACACCHYDYAPRCASSVFAVAPAGACAAYAYAPGGARLIPCPDTTGAGV